MPPLARHTADIGRFIEAFLAWRPGHAIVHPHAYYAVRMCYTRVLGT